MYLRWLGSYTNFIGGSAYLFYFILFYFIFNPWASLYYFVVSMVVSRIHVWDLLYCGLYLKTFVGFSS